MKNNWITKIIKIVVLGLLLTNYSFSESITDNYSLLNDLYKAGEITEEEFSKAEYSSENTDGLIMLNDLYKAGAVSYTHLRAHET